MNNTARLVAFIGVALFAQGALANTVWLKDRNGNVCYNNSNGNVGHVIGLGSINADGTGFTMTIDNPAGPGKPTTGDCASIPATTSPVTYATGSVAGNLAHVSSGSGATCKDQGTNLVAIHGASAKVSGRYLSFAFFNPARGCKPGTFKVPLTTANRQAFIKQRAPQGPGSITIFTGSYYVFNPASIPEPDSLLLLLAGSLSMAFIALRRSRRVTSPAG
jgi:hypothetical protein